METPLRKRIDEIVDCWRLVALQLLLEVPGVRLKVLTLECLGCSSHNQPSPSRGHRLLSMNSGMAERGL